MTRRGKNLFCNIAVHYDRGLEPESLQQRLDCVEERIGNACAAARRPRDSVRLLAVTKIFGPEAIRAAYGLGLREFGENYVQEMERKAPALTDLADARFHLIGHLQSNKAKKAAQLFSSVDTIDAAKLAGRLRWRIESTGRHD